MENFRAEVAADVQEKNGERVRDLLFMLQAIAEERVKRIGGSVPDQMPVALTAGSPRPHPGKPPQYTAAIRQFRLRYIGIPDDPKLQLDFRSRLSSPLLETPSEVMMSPKYIWTATEMFKL